jgi:Flp pilus assembly protein TadD
MIERRTVAVLAGILAAAAALRAAYLAQHAAGPYFAPTILDPGYYHAWALRILEGRGMGEPFFGLPLYPFFLASVYKLAGGSVLAAKALQGLLGLVHVVLVYALTRRIFRRAATGLVAAALAAFYAPYVFHEPILVPEALAVPLYTAALLGALAFRERPSVRRGLLFGALVGAAGLAKAGIFLFALAFVAASAVRNARAAATAACAAVLAVAPVALHNARAAGDAPFLSWHGGLNFYIGNNPQAEGTFRTPPGIRSNIEGQREDSRLVAEREAGRALKPSEISRFWFRKGWDFIRSEPGAAAALWAKKAALLVNHREISDVEEIVFSRRFTPLLGFLPFGFAGLFALAAAGGVLGWRSADPAARNLAFLWTAAYALAVTAFFVNARYRLPAVSALFPFAAAALVDGAGALRGGSWKHLGAALLLGGAALGASRTELVGPNPALQLTNVGNILMAQKRFTESVVYYREAIAADPSYAKAYNDLGIALRETRRYEEAARAFAAAVEKDPRNPYARNNLGLLLDAAGRTREAEALFEEAVRLQPNIPEAHNNLGMARAKLGDFAGAEEHFRRALELNPRSARALTNLGLLAHYRGRTAEARRLWERALEADPGFQDARRALEGLVLEPPRAGTP